MPSDSPRGVGGWLAFFCICLIFLAPLKLFVLMSEGWKGAQTVFSRFPDLKFAYFWGNLWYITHVIYGLIVGFIIWTGNQQGRDIARRFLLVRLFGSIGVAVIIFLIMIVGDLPKVLVAHVAGTIAGEMTAEMIYIAVWWSYFKKSKRVRNTYGPEIA